MFERTTREVKIKLPSDFIPKVSFGSKVRVGTLLGKGSFEIVLEEYPIQDNAQLFVEDGQFVQKDTKLFAIKGLFDEVVGISEHEGIVRITSNSLKIIDIVDDFEYKSPVKGRVVLLSPDELLIEAEMFQIPIFALAPHSTEAYTSVYRSDQPITNRIVILQTSPALQSIERLYRAGARAVVVPSIDWATYVHVQNHLSRFPFVILQGFGDSQLWSFYQKMFTALNGYYAQIDAKTKKLYITPKVIEFDRNYAYIFKDERWGYEVATLRSKSVKDANEYEVCYP